MLRRMKKAIPPILFDPRLSFFVFGSFVRSSASNDIDILILYDSPTIPSQKVYELIQPYLSGLKLFFEKDVDLTILSTQEESEIGFIAHESAVELQKVFPHLSNFAHGE
jgi:predicted nucleotidyltransferase